MSLPFLVTYSLWFISEVGLSLFRRSEKSEQKNKDKGSLGMIWTIIIAANAISFVVSSLVIVPISEFQNIRYLGLVLIIIGILLRFSIVATLGKFFTVNVTIQQGHKLKTDGFYRYVRHPSYAASLLSFVGYGVSLNNWLSLMIVAASVFAAFMIRIRIEEKALTDHFGKEYVEYTKRTKQLIPFLY